MSLIERYKTILTPQNYGWIIFVILLSSVLVMQVLLWVILAMLNEPSTLALNLLSWLTSLIIAPIAAWLLVDAAVAFNRLELLIRGGVSGKLQCLVSEEVFMASGGIMLELAKRYDKPLSVVLMSLSNPERIDWDKFNHIMIKTKRSSDLGAQIQPNQIVFVLPETAEIGAKVFITKVTKAIVQSSDLASSCGTDFKINELNLFKPQRSLEEMIDKMQLSSEALS